MFKKIVDDTAAKLMQGWQEARCNASKSAYGRKFIMLNSSRGSLEPRAQALQADKRPNVSTSFCCLSIFLNIESIMSGFLTMFQCHRMRRNGC
jgi:hypothetical protein